MNLTQKIALCGIILSGLGTPVLALGAETPAFDHSHRHWASVLTQFVSGSSSSTRVDYAELKKNAGDLNTYLKSLSGVTRSEFDNWSVELQLAFLINAYNAFTVKLIVDHYPIKSIRKIGSLFKNAWKKKFFRLLGEERNLDWIEHDTIRRKYSEPRIHFALNCASISCPPLRAEPFLGERLATQLEDASVAFLKDKERNRFDSKTGTLKLSKIFDWYGADFDKHATSVKAFAALRMGSNEKERKEILSAKHLEFFDYDWDLNASTRPQGDKTKTSR